jgi:hypothetical protein
LPFACPECESPASLHITAAIELPPDSRSDEIALQIVTCQRCGFRAAAAYEESRRGSLDSEAVHHRGYRAPRELVDELIAGIEACPDSGNRGCGCGSHRHLGRTDAVGRWSALSGIADAFPMEYSSDE